MPQLLLFPDPRPLVERLGHEFFRTAPESPGVYLMRDGTDAVLYVGKAKNLRKRLASYRVANPQRLGRRHLRLLRAVARIELRPCPDEIAALESEAALLRTLRPLFNRAGTWPGPPRYLAWRFAGAVLELAVLDSAGPGWECCGPLGAKALFLRAALARAIWCGLHPDAGVCGLPEGWFTGRFGPIASISLAGFSDSRQFLQESLQELRSGTGMRFLDWLMASTQAWAHPIDLGWREADCEIINDFALRPLPV